MALNHVPLTWSDEQKAATERRGQIQELLKHNYVGPVRALQASLNEFCHWTLEEVNNIFLDFPPLPGRRLYPMGPEARYAPPGPRRWAELAGKVAVVGVVDAIALVTSPLTLGRMSQEKRKEAVSGLVDMHTKVLGSSFFVSASLELMEEAGRRNQALCVNKWGQFRILDSGYAAISHVWAETMGLQFNDEKVEQDERGLPMNHFHKIMSKAQQCGFEWIWFDLLAIPKKSVFGSGNPNLSRVKTLIINSLHSIYRNAAAVIVLDSFFLNLPSGDPLRIAPLLPCGMWLTRIWTYQEVKLARRVLIVTATHVVDLRDIRVAVEQQVELNHAKWHQLRQTVRRLEPIHDIGINLADVALSCTNRNTENEVDYARGFFALLGLQWQAGWTYEDGIRHIYQSRPQELAMVANMHNPRGLPKPFSWAPKYLVQLQGASHAWRQFTCNERGLVGSWYTTTVLQLAHVLGYGQPGKDDEDKMAFQLLVRSLTGESVMVTVVTWGSNWSEELKQWTDAIPRGNTRLLCPGKMIGQFSFPIVLLSYQIESATASSLSSPPTHANVAEVVASAVLVNGTVEAPQVSWLVT